MNRFPALFRAAGLAVVLLMSLALVGCSSSAVRDLQLVVAASEAVVAALETSGVIPAPIGAAVNVYMGQVSEFVTFATTELASSDSSAVKASKIAAEAAAVAKPDLPPGTPNLIATAIQAVAASLGTFLGNIQATAAVISHPSYGNSFFAEKAAKLKISKADEKKLAELHARALVLKAKFPKK
jgi:hypothetical protein